MSGRKTGERENKNLILFSPADFMTLHHQEEERMTGFIFFGLNCSFKIILERKTSGQSSRVALKNMSAGHLLDLAAESI